MAHLIIAFLGPLTPSAGADHRFRRRLVWLLCLALGEGASPEMQNPTPLPIKSVS